MMINKKKKILNRLFKEHIETINISQINLSNNISRSSSLISQTIKSKKSVFWCGNGGSAADSQHLAAEFVGRFKNNRKPLKSIALTTDTSILTCISNDYSFDKIFSRQLNAVGSSGDILIAISTS